MLDASRGDGGFVLPGRRRLRPLRPLCGGTPSSAARGWPPPHDARRLPTPRQARKLPVLPGRRAGSSVPGSCSTIAAARGLHPLPFSSPAAVRGASAAWRAAASSEAEVARGEVRVRSRSTERLTERIRTHDTDRVLVQIDASRQMNILATVGCMSTRIEETKHPGLPASRACQPESTCSSGALTRRAWLVVDYPWHNM